MTSVTSELREFYYGGRVIIRPSDIPEEGSEFHLLLKSITDVGLESAVLCTDEWMVRKILDNQSDASSFRKLVSKLKVIYDSVFYPQRVSPDMRLPRSSEHHGVRVHE